MVVGLTPEIIDVTKKLEDVVNASPFKICRFEVIENGLGEPCIILDIRKEKKQ